MKKVSSEKIGLGTAAAATAGNAAAFTALTGGATSASAVTYALGQIGAIVGGGMAAGLGVVLAGPMALGGAAWGVSKLVKRHRALKPKKLNV